MTAEEIWALWHLGARGPITARALAGRSRVDPAGPEEGFEALAQRGYVQADPQGVPDLTARGRRALVPLARAGAHSLRPAAAREDVVCA